MGTGCSLLPGSALREFGTQYACFELAMKGRWKQPKTSGISLIELIALIAIFFIVSASIQIVSNGRGTPKSLHTRDSTTNQVGRDFHAPNDVIHTYAPRH
jgi:hypothetical protein